MSEGLRQPEFNALDQARQDAAKLPDPQRLRYAEWTGTDTPEQTQAAAKDLANYLESRPYISELKDGAHISKSHNLMDKNGQKVVWHEYFDNERDKHYNQSGQESFYESMSMTEIARELGKAELAGSQAKIGFFTDLLLDKTSEFASSQKTKRNPNGMTAEAQDKLLDRLFQVKDVYKQSLLEDQAASKGSAIPRKTGAYRLTPDDLYDNGVEKIGDVPSDIRRGNENKYGYAGPVKPGMEVELRKSSEIEPVKNDVELYEESEQTKPNNITSERLEELTSRLEVARKEFINLVAGRRGVTVFSKRYSRESLGDAQKAYEDLRDAAGKEAARLLQEAGYDKDETRSLSRMSALGEATILARGIAERRQEMAKDKLLHGFYDWWARQGSDKLLSKAGFKGAVKKAAVMTMVGLPLGVAAGAAGIFALGPVAGGAAAAALARGVTRGLASAKVSKEAGALTNAQVFASDRDYTAQKQMVDAAVSSGDILTTRHLTDPLESGTRRLIAGNRRRAIGSVAIATAAGVAGAEIFSHVTGGHTSMARQHPGTGKQLPLAEAPHAPQTLNMTPYEGYRYPWNYFADHYGAANATPRMTELVAKAQAAGWHVNGLEVPGPNNDEILNVISPNGQMYNTTPGIIAALEQFEA